MSSKVSTSDDTSVSSQLFLTVILFSIFFHAIPSHKGDVYNKRRPLGIEPKKKLVKLNSRIERIRRFFCAIWNERNFIVNTTNIGQILRFYEQSVIRKSCAPIDVYVDEIINKRVKKKKFCVRKLPKS